MRKAAGQVGRAGGRVASRLIRLLMLLVLVLGVGATALAWRLKEGPLSLGAATGALRAILSREAAAIAPGATVELDDVSLAWAGWLAGSPLPVTVRVEGLRLLDAAGTQRAAIPSLEVWVSVPRLLLGHVVPTRVVLHRPQAMLRRGQETGITLDLGVPSAEAPPGPAPEEDDLNLQDLLRPQPPDSPLAALREVAITDGTLRVWDEALGVAWTLTGMALTARRTARDELEGDGGAALVIGDQSIPVRVRGRAGGDPLVAEGSLELPSISPAALARTLPVLAPMAALDAPVAARFSARFAFHDGSFEGRAGVEVGPGEIVAAGRRTPFAAITVALSSDGSAVRLEGAELRPRPAREGVEAPLIRMQGRASRFGEAWRARAELRLDAVPVPDLRAYWPEGLAPGARSWILENVTAGTARDGAWWAEVEMPGDLDDVRLLDAGGSVRVERATVHWLRPIPPMEAADAVVSFGKEEVGVAIRSAQQSGTAIRASEGRLRITDLGATERLALEVRLTGPLADTLEVLKHPRLRLFERRPLDLREPSGNLDGTLNIAFPLLSDLPVERIQLSANARLTNGRIAALVAGQPLERANLDLSVDLTGLRIAGQANLGPVPSRVQAELDFRAGPPAQVTERVRAEGRADATAFNAFGVDPEDWVRGPVSVTAQVERRRNGEGRVALRGDLREAQLDLGPLGYVKRPGTGGTAEGTLRLQGETLRAMDAVRVEAPDLLFRGGLTFGARERVTRVEILEARIGDSRASGNIVLPPEPRGPWRIALRGPVADLRPMLDRSRNRPAGPGQGGATGPPLLLDVGFERLVLGEQRSAGPVAATVSFDGGGSLREMRASGRSGGGPFDLAIVPRGSGRAVELASNDGGAVLRGMGLFDDMEGGRLRMVGAWAGAAFASDLTAVAEVQDFSVRNAPTIGKFLQALTIYGIAEAARGPGLAFSRLYLPFTLTEEAFGFSDAQAFSASLGITARGRILRRNDTLEAQGTVVPAYMFNSLLGRLPLIGRLFSAEAGGGLFAATFRATGPVNDPSVSLNPLAALTPGVLRGLFSALERPDPPAAR